MNAQIGSAELPELQVPGRRMPWWMAVVMAVSQLVFTLALCSVAHVIHATLIWGPVPGISADVTLSELLSIALIGAYLMAWSGYVFTVLSFYLFDGYLLSWPKRAAINLGLLLLSLCPITLWFAELPLSLTWINVGSISISAICVLAADAITQLLWSFKRTR